MLRDMLVPDPKVNESSVKFPALSSVMSPELVFCTLTLVVVKSKLLMPFTADRITPPDAAMSELAALPSSRNKFPVEVMLMALFAVLKLSIRLSSIAFPAVKLTRPTPD